MDNKMKWYPNAWMRCQCGLDEYVKTLEPPRHAYPVSCSECQCEAQIEKLPDGFILIVDEWDELQIGGHRIRVDDAKELEAQAEEQAELDRELFHEAVTEEEAGMAIRIEDEWE